MAITVLTRFSGGNRDAMIALAKQAKPIVEQAGAEFFRLSQIYTGQWAGQLAVASRYPDWATYGQAQQALAGNAAYQALLAEANAISHLEGRTILTSIDL